VVGGEARLRLALVSDCATGAKLLNVIEDESTQNVREIEKERKVSIPADLVDEEVEDGGLVGETKLDMISVSDVHADMEVKDNVDDFEELDFDAPFPTLSELEIAYKRTASEAELDMGIHRLNTWAENGDILLVNTGNLPASFELTVHEGSQRYTIIFMFERNPS
jgi:hypothetical protein